MEGMAARGCWGVTPTDSGSGAGMTGMMRLLSVMVAGLAVLGPHLIFLAVVALSGISFLMSLPVLLLAIWNSRTIR